MKPSVIFYDIMVMCISCLFFSWNCIHRQPFWLWLIF